MGAAGTQRVARVQPEHGRQAVHVASMQLQAMGA